MNQGITVKIIIDGPFVSPEHASAIGAEIARLARDRFSSRGFTVTNLLKFKDTDYKDEVQVISGSEVRETKPIDAEGLRIRQGLIGDNSRFP